MGTTGKKQGGQTGISTPQTEENSMARPFRLVVFVCLLNVSKMPALLFFRSRMHNTRPSQSLGGEAKPGNGTSQSACVYFKYCLVIISLAIPSYCT